MEIVSLNTLPTIGGKIQWRSPSKYVHLAPKTLLFLGAHHRIKSFCICGFLICRLAIANIHFFQLFFLLDFVPYAKLLGDRKFVRFADGI